jgi:hypothetical protein
MAGQQSFFSSHRIRTPRDYGRLLHPVRQEHYARLAGSRYGERMPHLPFIIIAVLGSAAFVGCAIAALPAGLGLLNLNAAVVYPTPAPFTPLPPSQTAAPAFQPVDYLTTTPGQGAATSVTPTPTSMASVPTDQATPSPTMTMMPTVAPTVTSAPTNTPRPLPTPHPTSTRVPPTATARPQPTATATPRPQPTATFTPRPQPTATSTLLPAPTDTPVPQPTATFTPPPQPAVTFTPAPQATAVTSPVPPVGAP